MVMIMTMMIMVDDSKAVLCAHSLTTKAVCGGIGGVEVHDSFGMHCLKNNMYIVERERYASQYISTFTHFSDFSHFVCTKSTQTIFHFSLVMIMTMMIIIIVVTVAVLVVEK